MLYRISRRIVCGWQQQHIIPSECVEAYVYGVQLLLATILNTFYIAAISALVALPLAWIPFLVGFIPLRITAGGFHAKTPWMCSITFCGSYVVCLVLSQVLSDNAVRILLLITSAVTVLIVYRYSPVPAGNKPLSDNEKKENRKRSLVIASCLFLILSAFACLNLGLCFFFFIALGETVASAFLIAAKLDVSRSSSGKQHTTKNNTHESA